MNIVKYKKNARDQLLAFQHEHQFEGIRLRDSDIETGQTVYLEQNGQILGIASLYHNDFHPHFENLQFAVDTSNDELVTALYEALLDSHSESSPRLSLHLNEIDARNLDAFLKRYCFSMIIKTEFPQIDIDNSMQKLSNYSFPEGYRLENYSHLNEAETKILRDFRLKGYQKTHFWSPPLSIESPYWQETDLSAENQAISWAVFQDQEIVLCSDAHLEDQMVYLGWGWHDDAYEDNIALKSIWARVLLKQLEYCKNFEKQLTGEFDSLDKYGQYKSSLLTHLIPENFYTYQKTESSIS